MHHGDEQGGDQASEDVVDIEGQEEVEGKEEHKNELEVIVEKSHEETDDD